MIVEVISFFCFTLYKLLIDDIQKMILLHF